MDDARFDRLARGFGRKAGRRATLRGLAGATAAVLAAWGRPGAVAARPYSIPIGGACNNDRQCAPTAVSLPICAENGFSYDGPYNCCVTPGVRCDVSEECCLDYECIGGVCTDYDDSFNGLGDTTDAILSGGPGSLGLGEPCGYPEQCYSGSGLQATCADNGVDYGGICCTFYGFGCGSDRHCCGSLRCLAGVCTVPYEGFG